ncbi:MAG: hypothetical protein CL908_01380 [Deltaproteobacteria bacterium]|nr:hypothetical protein [Deltaproteobacteria bacterium]
MAERGRSNQAGKGDRDAAGASRKAEPAERPGASGHRFGPDLACSECGILWDLHQREPKPCKSEAARDAFSRRPSDDFDSPSLASSSPSASSSSPPSPPTPAVGDPKTDE